VPFTNERDVIFKYETIVLKNLKKNYRCLELKLTYIIVKVFSRENVEL